MKYVTDAAREYAKNQIKKSCVNDNDIENFSWYTDDQGINALLYKGDAIVKSDDQHITKLLSLDDDNFAIKLYDNIYIVGNWHPATGINSFKEYNDMLQSGDIVQLIDVQNNRDDAETMLFKRAKHYDNQLTLADFLQYIIYMADDMKSAKLIYNDIVKNANYSDPKYKKLFDKFKAMHDLYEQIRNFKDV